MEVMYWHGKCRGGLVIELVVIFISVNIVHTYIMHVCTVHVSDILAWQQLASSSVSHSEDEEPTCGETGTGSWMSALRSPSSRLRRLGQSPSKVEPIQQEALKNIDDLDAIPQRGM